MQQKVVYVVDRHGNPLMPTTRFGHVRRMLRDGLAVPIKNNPFTIRLKYDSTTYTQDVHLGIDPGRENIGVAASIEDGTNILLEDVRTNNRQVKSNMEDRAGFRRQRRRHDRQSKQRKARHDHTEIQDGEDCVALHNKDSKSVAISYPGADGAVEHKVIRGKEGKFNNRKRDDGWLTPSARQLLQMLQNNVTEQLEILPVTHLHIEMCAFDFQKLENNDISDWNHGPLYGFDSYKEYIFAEQHGKCAVCGKPIQQYHHIVPKKRNGVDQVNNIIGLCNECHREVHGSIPAMEMLQDLKAGIVRQYQVGLLNTMMPFFIDWADEYCRQRNITLVISHGWDTKAARDKLNLPKDHCVDAYAISLSDRLDTITASNVKDTDTVIIRRRFKKKSKNITAARNQREYRLNGKVVALNRHKAMDQKADSLEEYMAKCAKTHTEPECRRHFHELEIRPAKRTYTYRKAGLRQPLHPGDVIKYAKVRKTKGDIKTAIFVATSVSYSTESSDGSRQWHVDYYDGKNKNVKVKFCKPLESGCVQVTGKCTVAEAVAESARQDALAKKRRSKAGVTAA